MMIKHTLTGDAGELSPWLDGRTDLAKYNAGFQRLENFIVLPQGGVMKRPGLEAVGTVPGNVGGSAAVAATETTPAILAVPPSPATTGVLIEFQVSSAYGVVLALGGREMRAWVDGVPKVMVTKAGPPVVTFSTLTIPWLDADLPKLRWKQINDMMYFVHPDYPMWKLTRYGAADWELWEVDHGINQPLLKENAKEEWTVTTSFPVNATSTAWSSAGISYVVGARVSYTSKNWVCQKAHSSAAGRAPGVGTYTEFVSSGGRSGSMVTKPYWVETFTDESATINQIIDLTSNLDTWETIHVGSIFQIGKKRNSEEYESIMRATNGNDGKYSPTLVVQGGWTFVTFGSWKGTWIIQRSLDRGVTWEEVRRYGSYEGQMRNASTEGEEKKRVLMRLKWERAGDPSNDPYAILSATDPKVRGLVRITQYLDKRTVKGVTISPVEKCTTQYWSEGAWSKKQGYPSCIETHQARLVVAATREMPHSVWGSAIDDYPNFYIGTDADKSFFHTVPVGERDPILWLVSERQLLIGTGSGEFIMGGEDENGAITPEFGTAKRQSSHGSHDGGASAIFSDSVALFIQRGGTRVREYSYRFDQDRYDASNLNILADHLFANKPITDVAVQRMPFQVVWFLSDGKLYGLTYERQQNVVAWHRHSTQGEIISIATLRTSGPEDEVWLLVKRSGVFHLERFRRGSFTDPQNVDAHWKDGTAGLSYTAIYQPMTPEIPLANGSSRTREFRIHRIVPSLYRSRGGKYGQLPTGTLYPLGAGSSSALFTGEIEKGFPGTYSTNDGLCLVSDEPYPFSIRSVAIKFNVLGDAD